jgi:hypothetical protein
MFASRVKKSLPVTRMGLDGNPEEGTIVVRKLNARSLARASEARQIEIAKLSRAWGPEIAMAAQKAAEERTTAEEKANAEATPTPVPEKKTAEPVPYNPLKDKRHSGYDRDYVVKAGLDSWSFPEDHRADQILGDLDEETADLIFHEVLALSLPKPQEEAKAALGKS